MRRRRESNWEPDHRAAVRHRVAVEAARMLYHREVKEYLHAKREAARRQGTSHMPSNAEVHAQLLQIARKVDGDGHAQRLLEMRRAALRVMTLLEPMRPRLIGSVLTGHIRKGSDIDLHVYSEDVEAVTHALGALDPQVELVHTRKGGEPRDFVHVRLADVDGFEVEITLYPPEALHVRPRCGITGGPMRRASLPEVRQMLACPAADAPMPALAPPLDRDALERSIPELGNCRGVLQNHYHHLDVWHHTWAVVEGVERMLTTGFARFPGHAAVLVSHCDPALLLLGAVCHDLGKPSTASVGRDGRIRFIGHDVAGAAIARAVGLRLGLGRDAVERLVALVACHLEAVRIPAEGGPPSRIRRLFARAGGALPELALLSLADVEAARGPAQSEARIEEHAAFVDFLLEQWFDGGFLAHPTVPVSADDLRETFGPLDARTEARLLEGLEEAFVDGEFEGREEGLAIAAEMLEAPS